MAAILPSLSTLSPNWARDLPGHVILHVPSAWNSPPSTAQLCSPKQRELVSHMSHSLLSLIFLWAVCSALWALWIIRIYLDVLKSSALLKKWKQEGFHVFYLKSWTVVWRFILKMWTAEWSLHTQPRSALSIIISPFTINIVWVGLWMWINVLNINAKMSCWN